jgi:hypothetical protein
MSATAGDGDKAALTNRFIKIGHLTVNRVPDCPRQLQSDIVGAASRGSTKYQSQRGRVPDWTAHDQTFHRWPAVLRRRPRIAH